MATSLQVVHPAFIRTYKAEGTIIKGGVVKAGVAVGSCLQAGNIPAATGGILGVAMHAAVSGDNVDVAMPGATFPCVASAAVTKNDLVTSDAAGKLKTAVATATPGVWVVGMAEEAASGADVEFAVMIRPTLWAT